MNKLISKFFIMLFLIYFSDLCLAAGVVKGVTVSLTPPDMTKCTMLERIFEYPSEQVSSDFLVLAMLLAQDEKKNYRVIETEYANSTYKYANDINGNFVFSQVLDVTNKKEIPDEQTQWLFKVEDGTKLVLLPPTIYRCSYGT